MLPCRKTLLLLFASVTAGSACIPPPPSNARAPQGEGVYPLVKPSPSIAAAPAPSEDTTESPTKFDTQALFSMVVSVRTQLPNGRYYTCLGTMIAPTLALTAAHCTHESAPMSVAPAVRPNARRLDVRKYWLDPGRKETPYVDKATADVAILELAEPLSLSEYAHYAREPAQPGTPAVSMHDTPQSVVAMGFRLFPRRQASLYYASVPYAQAGDSGSPVFVNQGGRSVLVALLSGGNDEGEMLSRVDVLAKHLDRLVAGARPPSSARTLDSVKKK